MGRKPKGTVYNKTWMVKELSKRTFIRQTEIREVLDSFDDLFLEVMTEKCVELKNDPEKRRLEAMAFHGLFIADIVKVKAHKGWDAVRNQPLEIPETYKILFTPSERLSKTMRYGYDPFEVENYEELEEDEIENDE